MQIEFAPDLAVGDQRGGELRMHPLPGCEDSSWAALRHNGDGIMVATFAKTEPPQLMKQAGRLDGMFTKSPEMISHICLVRKNTKQKNKSI